MNGYIRFLVFYLSNIVSLKAVVDYLNQLCCFERLGFVVGVLYGNLEQSILIFSTPVESSIG